MRTRFTLVLVAFVWAAAACAADLPTGTWAVNVDGEKGDLVITQVKDGKVTGSLLGTDFTGTWNGKALAFTKGRDSYEAHVLSEPAEKGKIKYTLTGTRTNEVADFTTRAGRIHVAKAGWYAQLTAAAPVPTGFIRVEVRGTLVYDGSRAHVLVKRLVGTEAVETRVDLSPDDWSNVKETLTALNGKDVIVTGSLAERPRGRANPFGGSLAVGPFEIKAATAPK